MSLKEIWFKIEKILLYIIFLGFFIHGLLAIILTLPFNNCEGLRFLGWQHFQMCDNDFVPYNFFYGAIITILSIFLFRFINNPSPKDRWQNIAKLFSILLGLETIYVGFGMISFAFPHCFIFHCMTEFQPSVLIIGIIFVLIGIFLIVRVIISKFPLQENPISLMIFKIIFFIITIFLLIMIYHKP